MVEIPIMKKVRLKEGTGVNTMHTSYGTVTKEWTEVPEDSYVYKEMEVELIPDEVAEETTEEAIEEINEPIPEPESKPKPKKKPKKTSRRKKKLGLF